MILGSPAAFRAAVENERLDRVRLDDATLAEARAAIEECGLLLVGEPHGVRETSSLLHVLATELDAHTLAFEWSHDEVGDVVEDFLRTGAFDLDRLWALRESAEAFCGDGRFTVGHVALLERLRREGRLDRVICFDRLQPVDRDRELADRLLEQWNRRGRVVALTGAWHTALDGDTMAAHLARSLPLRPVAIHYERGRCWWHGEPREIEDRPPATPVAIRLPEATPADVPGR